MPNKAHPKRRLPAHAEDLEAVRFANALFLGDLHREYDEMPSKKVMHKFKHGKLHSGSKTGPVVKSAAQAKAILMSEKRKEKEGKKP